MKAVLVDDEKLALDLLDNYLSRIDNIEILGKYTDPIIAKEQILKADVDVLFLDIHQPGINGLELAEQIIEYKPEVAVIFVTGYDEYAVQAFELNALDYLVKPVNRNRLEKTIKRIEEYLTYKKEKPVVKEEKVQINVFRQLTIKPTNKEDVTSIRWRTKKAQELFLYLFHHRDQLVRKSTLVELLWPDYDVDRSYSQLYTTVYHVRKAIKTLFNHFTIKNTTEGYMLNVKNVLIDAEQWEKNLKELSPLSEQTIHQYIEIVNQYKGGYLQEYNYWWAEAERHRLETLWLNIIFQIAGWYDKNEEVHEAITWYEKICMQHPEAEEAYVALMKIYASLDEPLLVHKKYQQLEKALREELYLEPSEHTVTWYNKWKKSSEY
ncbi:response regulator [Massilibacterium senegalense]|uniref:response regulator n=1 Tax=Massilibacterium senegalense TaxID=1632858 RepID=UPI000784C477|nr:response regulator [Massilibacterium senegalense]